MRSILRYTPINNFSTHKLTQTIQNKIEFIKQQQNNHYLKYEQLFFKLYAVHLQRQTTLAANVKKLDTLCMMSQFPCKAIVQYFHLTSKSYSEDYVVQTFVRLARAYKISQADNSSTADFSIHRLFFTPAFENLIEQYKYGLRKQNAMTWNNAFLVAQCLIDIGYADYEVFSILLNMVQTRINKLDRLQTQIRPFQIQKKDYYVRRNRFTQQNLVRDEQFQSVIKMLQSKVKNHDQKIKSKNILQEVKKQLSKDQQSRNLYNSIQQTVSMIQSFNNDLNKLIEAILVIRKQYRQMVKLSQSKQILRNPGLNLQLLELQEILLGKKLISMADIKFNQRIENENLQLKRIQQILVTMIEPAEGLSIGITNQIGDLITKNNFDGQTKQMERQNKLRQVSQYGRGLATLSKFAQLSRRLYNSPDSRSLISMKWQKTLLLWNKQGAQTNQSRQNLHQQKIFRRTFADLYKMVKRQYSIFMFTFIQAPLKYKTQFFEALGRLGFHEQLIKLMQNEDSSKQKVQTYSYQQFISLIKVLNQVGSKISADHLKKSAIKYLKKLFQTSQIEQNKSLFNMQFCTNAINFISQNFNVTSYDMALNLQNKDQIQILYENLINRLTEQVKYIEQSEGFLTNDHLYEALRVLSIQRPAQFKLNNSFYRRFQVDTQNQKELKQFLYKKNPFFYLSQQMVYSYIKTQQRKNYPYIQTGFNSKGQLTAILLCSSNQSSMDGKHANGNTNAYIQRIRRQKNIIITPLCLNQLLDIDYDKLSQNKQFSFKSKEDIKRILNLSFKKDQIALLKFSEIIINISFVLEKHFKRNFMYGLIKFLNTLNESTRLFEKEKELLTYDLFRFRRYRLYVQLDTLKEDYNLIDKTLKEELEKLWRKQASSVQGFKKNSSILGTIQSIQQSIIQSVNSKNQQSKTITKDFFEGKRFTIDSFVQDIDNYKPNIGIEFINTVAYVDKTFCPYKDWNQQLTSEYPLQTIKLSQSSNVTKILSNKYLPKVKQQISILPWTKKKSLKQRKQLEYTSLQKQTQQSSTKQLSQAHSSQVHQAQNSKNDISQTMLTSMNSLLSFIHELKIQKSQQQLIEYIFSFDFIDKLMTNKSYDKNNSASQLIHRKTGSYLEYLQTSNNKLYLESPNLQYLFTKLQKREEVFEVFNQRKQKRNLVKIQHQLGRLNRKQLYQEFQKIDNQIIDKIKTLEKNLLDNVQEHKLFEGGLKMIRIEQDQKQIQRVLNRTRYYDRLLDKDFIHVKGQKERLIKIKRNKSERMLALYKTLYKLAKGQTQLTQHDKQILTKEANYIQYRLENQKDAPEVFSQRFTSFSISDLSKADKERLKLRGVDLSKVGTLALSDLILELNNLLDVKVYQNFQKIIIKKHYNNKVGIPEDIFSSSLNKEFSKLAGEQQRAIISQHSKLDFYELGLLNQMVQTFKTQSKTGKQRFGRFYESFYEDIQQMNNCQARIELISEYLNLKEIEYTDYYNPKLVNELKQRQVMKLWDVIFKKSYNECETQQIQKMTNKICQRIRLMGQNPPPFFGLLVIKILQHPKTDLLTKQNLIANIQFFKVPLKLDSQDIRILGYQSSIQQRQNNGTRQQLLERMALTSNKNFMENINKKINMIV